MEKQISLRTLPDFTAQEVFEHISKNLLLQKKASKQIICGKEICAYRGDDGTKCAAGYIISDEEYNEGFENKTFYDLFITFFREGYYYYKKNSEKYHFKLIEKMQKIHDNICVDDWKIEFIKLGNEFSLDTKFLEK